MSIEPNVGLLHTMSRALNEKNADLYGPHLAPDVVCVASGVETKGAAARVAVPRPARPAHIWRVNHRVGRFHVVRRRRMSIRCQSSRACRRLVLLAALLGVVLAIPAGVAAQGDSGAVVDATIPPGANFDKANFRLWLPGDAGPSDAVLVLVPGSNGDGRPEASDAAWRTFATRHHLAIVACEFTDKAHDQGFIEEYVNVARGSGQALLDALGALAARAKRPEIATAPLLMWGMSAGGQFNYEFVAWKPERVLGFVVNKGGIYYTALVPRASRSVPGIFFTGEKDLWSRTDTIAGLFAVNRRAGALWALAQEPGVAHVVGRSRDVAMVFFEEVLALRLGAGPSVGPPRALLEKDGFLGDLVAKTLMPVASGGTGPTAWLPSERAAGAWRAMVTGQPFER
jgi:poly(3-hydroxybutyrate) depolymerase